VAQTCNLTTFASKVADLRKTAKPVKRFKPLFEHMIVLAKDSAERGYCQRAGRELKHAKKVAGYR
jgi:hypothetical protein